MGNQQIRLFVWQRVKDTSYPESLQAVRDAQSLAVGDLHDALSDVAAWLVNQTLDIEEALAEDIQELADELERETPFDPDGPNDPPLHASEAWNIRLIQRPEGELTITISNPKDYIQFLELHGGRPDHPGADEGGWIQDAFDGFRIRLLDRTS